MTIGIIVAAGAGAVLLVVAVVALLRKRRSASVSMPAPSQSEFLTGAVFHNALFANGKDATDDVPYEMTDNMTDNTSYSDLVV